MNLQLFTKWYAKYVLFALCCIVLLIVPLLKGPWIGTDVFLFSRLAENPSLFDPLSFGGRVAAYQWGTPLVLSIAPNILIEILPFILGVLSFLLFRKILRHFTNNEITINLSSLLLILSPGFIYLFSFTNGLFISLFLSLLAFYFFINKELKYWSIAVIAIIPLFNVIISSIFMVILFAYSFFLKKDRKKLFLFSLIIALAVSTVYFGSIILQTGIPNGFSIEEGGKFFLFKQIFYDFGSLCGLGLFLTILAIIGITSNWKNKYSNLFLFISTGFLIVVSFFRQEALLFLNIFLILFASKGLIYLAEFKWADINYKKWIILIILSGLVFSSISQMNRLTDSMPNQEILDGLDFLSEKASGVVLTDYSRGVWITSAGQKNIFDENYRFINDSEQRWNDMQDIFYSREFETTNELFEKYDVNYVWIDTEMKENIWGYDSEGLLFILQYTKDFNKIYDKDGIEIWEIKR